MTDAVSETVSNPFDDHADRSEVSSSLPPTSDLDPARSVLVVDRNVTLTLGTDALILLDEGLRQKRQLRNACGFLPQLAKTTRAIPFYNVLWAELTDDLEITIHYAESTGKRSCAVRRIHYTLLDKTLMERARLWAEALLNRAYPPNVKRRKRVKGVINPFGGQGYAEKLWARQIVPIFTAAKMELDVEKTKSQGHAMEIARNLDIDAFDAVACASGDGGVHEVFNGLAKHKEPRRALRKIAVVQMPCGTGNALSLNLNGTDSPSLAALAVVKGVRTPLDLMAITQGAKLYYSFLSQSVGIIAESDLGTESLRWLGSFRFTWGVLVRLLSRNRYPATVSVADAIGDKGEIRNVYRQAVEEHLASVSKGYNNFPSESCSKTELPPLRYGTVNDPLPSNFTPPQDYPDLGNFYVGNLCWMSPDVAPFPTTLPSDGKMDMMNVSAQTSRLTSIRILSTIGEGTMMNYPQVEYSKITAYRIHPRVYEEDRSSKRLIDKVTSWLGGRDHKRIKREGGLIAVDGEKVPFEPFQVEVVPGLATVLSKNGTIEFDSEKFLKTQYTQFRPTP